MPSEKRFCYYIPQSQDPKEHGGFVPSLVVENEPGHSPMTGNPEKLQAPWVWGKTLDEADEVCRMMNEEMGISPDAADRIVASSMNSSL